MTLFQQALSLLNRAAPNLAGEIRVLMRELLLVANGEGAKFDFDGGSSYTLWSGMYLNVEDKHNPLDVAETLAHESGHTLLFGLTYDEPLVLNEESERFASPLRDDLRPMDGIYHATYVSARMLYTAKQLSQLDDLSAADRALLAEHQKTFREGFNAGYEVVAQHAKLSETGRTIMANAYTYMNG